MTTVPGVRYGLCGLLTTTLPEKTKNDKAGEGALFPELTVFSNQKASEFLMDMNSKETTYNFYDDETGELCSDIDKWTAAFLDEELNSVFDVDAKNYLERVIDGDTTTFYYDSDGDGKMETAIGFSSTYGTKPLYQIDNGTIAMNFGQEYFSTEKYYGDVLKFSNEVNDSGFSESEFPNGFNRQSIWTENGSTYIDIEHDENGYATSVK